MSSSGIKLPMVGCIGLPRIPAAVALEEPSAVVGSFRDPPPQFLPRLEPVYGGLRILIRVGATRFVGERCDKSQRHRSGTSFRTSARPTITSPMPRR